MTRNATESSRRREQPSPRSGTLERRPRHLSCGPHLLTRPLSGLSISALPRCPARVVEHQATMSMTSAPELEAIYRRWSTEKLAIASTRDADQYDPAALPIMRRVLDERGLSPADLDATLADARSGHWEKRAALSDPERVV